MMQWRKHLQRRASETAEAAKTEPKPAETGRNAAETLPSASERAENPQPKTVSQPLTRDELVFLKKDYPDCDLQALLESELFQQFAESMENDPEQIELAFADFVEALRSADHALKPPVSRVTGAAAAHTGSPLNAYQRRELARWNREYPEYRMSEREYFRSIRNNSEF